ncbi:hypothetical protein GCM10010377_07570 [Streptomyces viridiviolaceus]|uniref:Secreted protein n=1 Tax=Streptomyces viridiviolaceus TaxID=68282 RepID=A0ABW2E9A3_9ACTN|nr:hypothetical protein [Streptomyces viridiviolaceus]GHB20125.1 hypothetical protein GCM10010377_07570 [Streptomyces viridiviolaceus]
MKHRGRHRRRKRGRALRAALTGAGLALTAAATLISASQADTVADDPGALKPLAASAADELSLTEHRVPQRWLDRLASAMGGPVGVGAVLDTADHTLRDAADCSAGERETLPVAPAATRVYCWDDGDTRGWRPGAVTTSGDADDDGRWGGNRVIISAWSREDGTADGGLARISFVDADDPGHLEYASALLAVPVDGGRDYRGLSSPVSGMVWYRDKLLVTTGAGDRNALYVYDVDRIQRTTSDAGAVGRVPGGWAAHGHRYVLPAVASYGLPDTPGAARPGAISLDRGTAPDSLVAAERVPAGAGRPTRLWRYALGTDPARAGLPAADSAGQVTALEAYETQAAEVGGVLSHRPAGVPTTDWYLGRAAEGRGTLWRQSTEGARSTECGADRSHRCWSAPAGSLSYWAETGEVWSQAGRTLFALPLATVHDSLA